MMGGGVAADLQAAWLRRGWRARLLWPVSLVYRVAWMLRRIGYRTGILPTHAVPVPLVVVGNLVAGGAGKTPAVVALVGHLVERGLRVGVVSRGYGRHRPEGDDDQGLEVRPDGDPRAVGDEPLLICRRTGVPVFVGRDRVAVARRLLARHPDLQVLVCDDGLQHLALGRDIEICVFDDRGVGNGWLLPAGPLREPWPRPVDLVLHTGGRPAFAGYRGMRRLADEAIDGDGGTIALDALATSGKRLTALAGIARPDAFFGMLRDRGLPLSATHGLPDHADFDAALPTIESTGRHTALLCTEKDAAKLWRSRPDALAVPLLFSLPPDFLAHFDRLLDARLSSGSRAPASR